MQTQVYNLDVKVEGRGITQLSELLHDCNNTVLLSQLPTDTHVNSTGAVIAGYGDQSQIDVGSYVQITTALSMVRKSLSCTLPLLFLPYFELPCCLLAYLSAPIPSNAE